MQLFCCYLTWVWSQKKQFPHDGPVLHGVANHGRAAQALRQSTHFCGGVRTYTFFVMGNSMRFCLKIDPKSNGWKQTIWFVTMANLVDSFFLPTLLAFILHAQGKKNPHHFIDGQINLFLWGVLLHIFNRLPMFPKGAIKMGLVNDQQILLNKRLVLLAKNGAII